MWEAEVDQFTGLLRQIFPTDAIIQRAPSSGDLSFEIDWTLNSDPDRPNKRSRLVVICLSREFMADYVAATPSNRAYELKRIVEQIKSKLAKFDPTHELPANTLPPKEIWNI